MMFSSNVEAARRFMNDEGIMNEAVSFNRWVTVAQSSDDHDGEEVEEMEMKWKRWRVYKMKRVPAQLHHLMH